MGSRWSSCRRDSPGSETPTGKQHMLAALLVRSHKGSCRTAFQKLSRFGVCPRVINENKVV